MGSTLRPRVSEEVGVQIKSYDLETLQLEQWAERAEYSKRDI